MKVKIKRKFRPSVLSLKIYTILIILPAVLWTPFKDLRKTRNEVTLIILQNPLIAVNWKMHATADEARRLARAVRESGARRLNFLI